ncbi:MAG: guanitoxin biosynthesis pre-guanitoxin forming N-methyltransferase GntF [Cyanobacteria bacterium P01_F01_bin.116]
MKSIASPTSQQQVLAVPNPSTTSTFFEARSYLEEYFLDLNQEYEQLYRFWVKSANRFKPKTVALEVGVGPTLYSTFPLVTSCREVHLADYAYESFMETQKWLNDQTGQFDWMPHIALILQTEAALHGFKVPYVTVHQRAAMTRKVVTQLLVCDMRQAHPLQPKGYLQAGALSAYDVVTAHYCTEAATSNNEEWQAAIANLASLVKPDGFFLLSVCSDLNRFRQYADQKPVQSAPNIDIQIVINTLEAVGMDLSTLWLEEIPAPADRPYSSTILVSVQKS